MKIKYKGIEYDLEEIFQKTYDEFKKHPEYMGVNFTWEQSFPKLCLYFSHVVVQDGFPKEEVISYFKKRIMEELENA